VEIYVSHFVVFLLLLLRCMSLVVTAPVFGHIAVPVQVKVAIGVFLAFVLFPMVSAQAPSVDVGIPAMALLAMQEVVVGLTIGFAAGIIFNGVRAAGELIGFDMGLSMATVFDPEAGMNNLVGGFLSLAMVLVFLMVNGHHFVLQGLFLSYHTVPIGGLSVDGGIALRIVGITGTLFVVAVKLAAPIIVASFLLNVALAVLSRVAPQINVFVMSFPLKIGVGFVVLMASSPLLVYVFKEMLTGFEDQLLELIKAL
jgi:flagellar biosynthetic protein FliR